MNSLVLFLFLFLVVTRKLGASFIVPFAFIIPLELHTCSVLSCLLISCFFCFCVLLSRGICRSVDWAIACGNCNPGFELWVKAKCISRVKWTVYADLFSAFCSLVQKARNIWKSGSLLSGTAEGRLKWILISRRGLANVGPS